MERDKEKSFQKHNQASPHFEGAAYRESSSGKRAHGMNFPQGCQVHSHLDYGASGVGGGESGSKSLDQKPVWNIATNKSCHPWSTGMRLACDTPLVYSWPLTGPQPAALPSPGSS